MVVVDAHFDDVFNLTIDHTVDGTITHETGDFGGARFQRNFSLQRGDLDGTPQDGNFVFQGTSNTQVLQTETQSTFTLVFDRETQLTHGIQNGISFIFGGGGNDVSEQEVEGDLGGNDVKLELLDFESIQTINTEFKDLIESSTKEK